MRFLCLVVFWAVGAQAHALLSKNVAGLAPELRAKTKASVVVSRGKIARLTAQRPDSSRVVNGTALPRR